MKIERGDEMAELFPEDFDKEELDIQEIEEQLEEPAGYKKGICFDDSLGDFKRDGTMKLVECSGIESWIQWCMKMLQTKRYVCQAYSDDIGIDLERAFTAKSREEAESILRQEITEALEADPYGRTEFVQSVEFQWKDSDSIEASCVVVGMDSNEIELTITMER